MRPPRSGGSVSERLAAAAASALIGRAEEGARLTALLAPDGPAAVFVHGPGGIGKTALVTGTLASLPLKSVVLDGHQVEPTVPGALAAIGAALGVPTPSSAIATAHAIADTGTDVLVVDTDAVRTGEAVVADAHCFGAAGRLALAPAADWLRTPQIRSALGRLEPVWQLEVDRLVPTVRSRTQPAAAPRGLVDAWQRHRFFEGLSRALLAVGRPLLLTLDNLHWCDRETLALLTFCLGLTPDAPMMVVATMREEPDGSDPGLTQWIVGMRATGMLTEIDVRPFEAADTAALAASLTGRALAPPDAELLQATTGGFPLFIVEVARTGNADALPTGDLAAVLANRLALVSEPARAVAGLAAAVGRTFNLDLLTEAADLDADTVVRAVDELWRQRILREADDGYDFSHDLLRDAAYAQVSPPRRWLLHRRIAHALELLHADNPDAASAQLAHQYARGGQGKKAVHYYQRAAEVAARTFAHDEAIRLHDEALAIVRTFAEGPDRMGRELSLLEGLAAPLNARFGYASPRLRETLERSLTLAEALGRRDSVIHSLVALWTSQFVHGDTAAAHRTATRALALVEPGSELSGAAHFTFGGSALGLGRPAEAVRHLAVAGASGGTYSLSVGTRPDVHSRAWVAHAHWLLGDPDGALSCCTEAIALARTTGSPLTLAVALGTGAITHQLRGDLPALADVVGELAELCDRYSFAYYREWAPVLAGWLRTDGSGVPLTRRGIDRLTADGFLFRMPYWLSLLADLLARDGCSDGARATLDAAIATAQAHDDVWWLPEVLRLRAAYDQEERAVARLHEAARLAASHGSVALLARCTAALRARGAAPPAFAVPPAPRTAAHDTNALGTTTS